MSFLKSSDTFSKEVNSGRRKPYAVNVKAALGKYALCVYTLYFVCTSNNSYMYLYFAKRYVALLNHKFHNALRSYHQSAHFFCDRSCKILESETRQQMKKLSRNSTYALTGSVVGNSIAVILYEKLTSFTD